MSVTEYPAIMSQHRWTLDLLSRVQVLVSEHRDELPALSITLTSHNSLTIQVTEYSATQADRVAAVRLIAESLHLSAPVTKDGSGHHDYFEAQRTTPFARVDVWTPIRKAVV